MHRPILKTAVALCLVALAGCGTPGTAANHPAPTATADADAGNSAASSFPANLDAEIQRAQLLRTQGKYADAVHSLSQMMMVAPDDPRVVGEYGKVLAQQGRSSDAVAFLERAVALQSDDWTLYSALGVAYDQLGDQNRARRVYERALALKPGEPAVLNNYAMSRMLAGDVAGARQLIAQAAQAGSDDPQIAQNLAMIEKAPVPGATPVAAATTQPAAKPTPNAVANVSANGVMMQAVPHDAKAGPVAKATHEPRRLAKLAEPPALRAADGKPAKTAVAAKSAKPAAHSSELPSLRMAADAVTH